MRPSPQGVVRQLVGEPDLEVEIEGISTWTVNNMYATHMQNGRVFCMGDATHRHPPSNGLGSNTSIQDAFNLAWKLAHVVKSQAGMDLLESFSEERAPIAKQIVSRANKSIEEFGPIFKALGLLESIDPVRMQENMDARCADNPQAEAQREAIRKAIQFKVYEFDAHGVEMNQRYMSRAVETDGEPEPEFTRDPELHYQPTTWPGARLPHAWLFSRDGARKASTLDLCGHGAWTVLTGIGGQAWADAAERLGQELGIKIRSHVIGPRHEWQDLAGEWVPYREIRDGGVLLVRPDHHVAWRSAEPRANAEGELRRVLKKILAR
jgi:2,4-dichlorophenol 6-monooxygenase